MMLQLFLYSLSDDMIFIYENRKKQMMQKLLEILLYEMHKHLISGFHFFFFWHLVDDQ